MAALRVIYISQTGQDVEEEKPTQQEHDNEDPTSENELYRAYDHMTTLLLFVGYSRSRHSLVSSLLDAHPHVIVADESYALRKWVQSPVWKTTKSKYDFFDTMMGSSVSSFKHGRRSRDTKGSAANLQIFGYNIPDQWQATYDRHIQVMGDKTAWDTAVMLRQKGTDAIYEMERKLGVKVKFLHVVRNPFDNIATFVLRHREIQARTADPDIKQINASDILDTKIQLYNNWAEGSYVAQQSFPQDFINVVSMDVVKKPAGNTPENMRFPGYQLFRKVYPGLRGHSRPSPFSYPASHCMDGRTDKTECTQ
ncbi:hypothetical protein OS493_039738 [Desmophyllum pertusum]|uniref:Protein-tyrosine sulfotransferase n=1 Tax=Desmophyllum pertusum TaxID=174260 RepID=A0A9W9Z659_9CNID|nr:hypothetical protein OS493_039738 [Desmophyllum pertusum]